ncbi:MAG: DNA repair protein RecO [Parachlamydiaceae bacterium]
MLLDFRTDQKLVGIVLHTLPFQDYHQIISLYSAEWGLVRIIIKYAYAKKKPCAVEALNLIEVVIRPSKNDLFQAKSVSLINSFLALRKDYAVLTSSLDLLNTLLQTQFPHKPAPILFSLILRYLEWMPKVKYPRNLASSFKLKVLRYDGSLAIQSTCAHCSMELSNMVINQGQLYCHAHPEYQGLYFSNLERIQLETLAINRSLIRFEENFISSELEEKINSLFAELK